MRALRWLAGGVLWILASVLGLVAVVLCITLILLPLGLPLLRLVKRLFRMATRLMLPRAVTHPVEELGKGTRKTGRWARSTSQDITSEVGTKGRTAGRRLRKKLT